MHHIRKENIDNLDKRRKIKREFDAKNDLSNKNNHNGDLVTLDAVAIGQTIRLLDEGAVISGDGYPLFYLRKGVLKEYYENLSNDYVGTINIAHTDYSSWGELTIVGEWTKKDLTLVELGDGRYALDVNINESNLDNDSIFLNELRRKGNDIAISAEFYGKISWDDTDELSEKNNEYIPVYKCVDIRDFAIVGSPGNVNSTGKNLKEEKKLKKGIKDMLNEILGKKEEAKKLDDETKTKEKDDETKEALSEEEAKEVLKEKLAAGQKAIEELEEANELAAEIGNKYKELKAENEELKEQLEKLKDSTVKKEFTTLSSLCKELGIDVKKEDEEFKKQKELSTESKKTADDILPADGWGVL